MALIGLRAYVAIALIILAPTETRSDIGGGHGDLSAQTVHLAGSSDSFVFFEADSAPTSKIPAVELSAVSLRAVRSHYCRWLFQFRSSGAGSFSLDVPRTTPRNAPQTLR